MLGGNSVSQQAENRRRSQCQVLCLVPYLVIQLNLAANPTLPLCLSVLQTVPEVVEMPWWAYGPVGMQLWFPSIVLAAMQLQTLHSSGSNSALHSQVSLPAQLTPHAASTGAFVGGLGSRAGSGVPGILARSGSSWPPGQGLMGLPSGASSVAALAAAGAAAAGQPGGSVAAALHMKHAQSAPLLAQDGAAAAAAGGFQTIQYGTEIELEFDREVYPIGVSLADASIVGVTQRVMRPQQPSAAQVRAADALLAVGARAIQQQ
jgi:hypothetical protein